jgi:hypothetical protein
MRLHPFRSGLLATVALAAVAWTASPSSALAATPAGGTATTAAAASAPAAARIPVAGSVRFAPPAGVRPAVNPDCVLSWIPDSTGRNVNAHISTFLFRRHNIRAVKVNAQVKCRRVSTKVHVDVTLWKTGLILPHKVAGPVSVNAAKGNLLKNQKTWKQCKNRTMSTYYGTAFGSVVFRGVTYSASLQTPKKVPLACGT